MGEDQRALLTGLPDEMLDPGRARVDAAGRQRRPRPAALSAGNTTRHGGSEKCYITHTHTRTHACTHAQLAITACSVFLRRRVLRLDGDVPRGHECTRARASPGQHLPTAQRHAPIRSLIARPFALSPSRPHSLRAATPRPGPWQNEVTARARVYGTLLSAGPHAAAAPARPPPPALPPRAQPASGPAGDRGKPGRVPL